MLIRDHKFMRSILVSVALILVTLSVQAQDTRVAELERILRERDTVISELLERVETLERRVGVQRRAAAPAEVPDRQAALTAENEVTGETGPAPPGMVVVEEGAAERALERSLTREGALLLPSGILEVEPGFSYTRKEDTSPDIVTVNGGFFSGELERNADNLTADLALRMGLPWDSQIEIGLPYRWREVESVTNVGFAPTGLSSNSGSGLGDVRVGLAKTLLRESLWLPDLVGRITWDTDTGTTGDDGVILGGGLHEIRTSLTAIKRQDPIAFFGGISYGHTIEKDMIQPGSTVSANFGSFIALSPETSLRLLLSASIQDNTDLFGTTIEGSDRFAANFIVGGSTLLAPGILLNLSAGIGLTDDADDFSILVSLPIRFGRRLF